MNLSHINFNEITDVKLKNVKEDENPDYESARIKSAVYQGKPLTKEQVKELNNHHQYFILEKIFETVLA